MATEVEALRRERLMGWFRGPTFVMLLQPGGRAHFSAH